MNKSRIGILGGMGPAATLVLQQRILNQVAATRDEDHIPLLIDMNPQVPSRIDYLIHKRGENPGPTLARMARQLQNCGADALAMPCCTAHHFAKDIRQATSVPFLNMVDLTAAELAHHVPRNGSIGILASPANRETRLFETAFEPYGLTTLYPGNMGLVLEVIEQIKADGIGQQAAAQVQSTADALVSQGAEALLLGCTEFSLLSSLMTAPVPVVDALDVLTKEIVTVAAGTQVPMAA